MSEDKGKENASTTNEDVSNEKKWGRVLICGGTDWANLGRKEKKGGSKVDTSERPDLYEPHILRSLSNVKIISIHTSCAGCHCIAIDIDGNAWMFGRNAPSALGCEGEVVSETTPRKLSAKQIGAPKGTTFVHAACGRNHSLLIGSNGDVWTAGANSHGQCGQSISTEVSTFTLLRSPLIGSGSEKVTKAAAGINFSILLTESGKLYAVGSGEHGQLGNGRTGEHIAQGNKTMFDMRPEPIPVKGLEDKVITQISCGQQHTIALDSEGIVYVWGYNGYCRLGLGNQQDVLIPKVVPQFAGSNMLMRGEIVAAGPSNSIVLDRQKMFWMAGKWKNSGEGSSGSPYSSFRYMQDIMGCKMYHCASGGVTHWALAPDDDETVMTIAWGQNAANGELGLGPDQPKSATKPTRHQPLIGIDVFDIAPGQNTTYFLAAPNAKFSDLPRHPLEIDSPELCVVCSTDKGDDDAPLECDKCDHPYHLGCLDPPLNAIPEGEWFCPNCSQVDDDQAATRSRRKASQKDDDAEDADGDDDEEEAREVGKKRRGRPSLNKAAKRKK